MRAPNTEGRDWRLALLDAMVEAMPRAVAEAYIKEHHYTHSYPAGKSWAYLVDPAIVVFSISANPNLESYLFREPVALLELSRLWAPDGHEPNLLTRAISLSVKRMRRDVPDCEAVVSYADPNVGHLGIVYRAASWLYCGESQERRRYTVNGKLRARRAFHSNDKSGPTPPPTLGLAKHRYVKLLTRRARKLLQVVPSAYEDGSSTESCTSRSASEPLESLGTKHTHSVDKRVAGW